jgi:hypothetical protein
MTDFTTHLARMLAFYKERHKDPAWADYVEHRVADMAARHPELYSGLAEQFLKPRQTSSAARRSSGR